MHENITCSPYVLYAQMAIYTHFFFVSPGMAAFAQQDQHINEFSLNISCVLRGKVRDVIKTSHTMLHLGIFASWIISKQSSDQEACSFIY